MADRNVKTTKIEKKYTDKKTGQEKSISFDYAKAADRLLQFRTDCPNGVISTTPEFLGDKLMFKAFVKKDKGNPDSAEATGHALATKAGEKEFEKLETISVARALAMLGYAMSGEIASSEEMDEFNKYKREQKEEAIASTIAEMNMATTIEEVRKIGRESNLLNEPKVVEAGKKRVAELTAKELKNEDN